MRNDNFKTKVTSSEASGVDANSLTGAETFIEQENLPGPLVRRSRQAFCPVCAEQSKLVPFEDAAARYNTDLQDIEYLSNRGEIHKVHNRRGRLMICDRSLSACFESRRTRLLDSGFFEKVTAEMAA